MMEAMTPENARLVIEAIVVTLALSVAGGYALYAFAENKRREPGALSEMHNLVAEMSERMDGYERGRARDRQEMERLRVDLGMWKNFSRVQADYIQLVVGLLQRLGYTDIPPAPVPPVTAAEQTALDDAANDRSAAVILASLFDMEELDDLAFQLGVDHGQIEGTTVTRKARSMVTYFKRRGRLDDLIALARKERPEGGI